MTRLDKAREKAKGKAKQRPPEVKQKAAKTGKLAPTHKTSKTIKTTKTMKTIEVKLIKSLIGRLPRHRKCVYGLGLRRIGQKVEVLDTSANRGMINKVDYLLEVLEVEE